MSKCKHATTRPMWKDDADGELIPVTRRCADCQAIGIESLGPANEEPTVVQEEIEAPDIEWEFAEHGTGSLGNAHRRGWVDHITDEDPPEVVGLSWRAGWLARELATHDMRHIRDHDGWPWDISRPIAEQGPVTEPTVEAAAEVFGDQISAGITDLLDTPRWPSVDEAQETRRIGAAEYEQARDADPDPRDDLDDDSHDTTVWPDAEDNVQAAAAASLDEVLPDEEAR